MGIKDLFKREDTLTTELSMLPRETKQRILDNVNRRRGEIIQEKILENQLKAFKSEKENNKKTFGQFREGMQRRREELREKGILQPIIRVNKENFRSPMEEASRRARAAEIQRLEDQRNKLKSGSTLESNNMIKMNKLKLKIPKSDSPFSTRRKSNYLKDGII